VPDSPGDQQTRLKAALDAEAAAKQAEVDAQAATRATRVEYDKAHYQAMLDATKGALDRWRSGAELVQKSAAAIGTLYAGILGVTFSVSGRQLPIRGVVPAIFLGLAIALSTVYVAYSTEGTSLMKYVPPESPPERMRARLNDFLRVIHENVGRRVSWLRASVIAPGMGVLFLPAPFIAFSTAPPPNLDQRYPWPSPPAVADANSASLVSIVYKNQVDEVAAERQRAQAADAATADLGVWAVVTVLALAIVLGIPLVGWYLDIANPNSVPPMPVAK
jgi:hypothetical protein